MEDGKGVHVDVRARHLPPAAEQGQRLPDRPRRRRRRGRTYSGVEGIAMQDASLQESMGPIVDRTKENLVSTDNGIIMARHRLMRAAKALARRARCPPGAIRRTSRCARPRSCCRPTSRSRKARARRSRCAKASRRRRSSKQERNTLEEVLAAVRIGPGKTEIREFPMPDIPDDGALLKMEVAGICGTDVKMYKHPPSPRPVIMGHENIGYIAKAGPRVHAPQGLQGRRPGLRRALRRVLQVRVVPRRASTATARTPTGATTRTPSATATRRPTSRRTCGAASRSTCTCRGTRCCTTCRRA